jgi:tRNA wybutosine-synthesizing protein 2
VARPGPLDAVRATLQDELGPEAPARLPRAYFRVGDVLLLDLPLPEPEARVAEAYARALGMRSVLGRTGGIEGEFRQPRRRLVWGDPRTETTHVEAGVRFRLDPARVMWSPGNLSERQRLAAWRLEGETVVDCFAGVGYLSLPLAVHARPDRIVAIEKSPETHAYLVENVRLNGVEDRMEPRWGDCREVAPRAVADRVLLGLLPDALPFVATGVEALRPRGGRLHVHRVVPAGSLDAAFGDVRRAVEAQGRLATLEGTHVVKSFGPGRDHVVFDVAVTR